MTLAELAPQFAAGVDTSMIRDGCGYVSVRNAPPGMSFMVEGGRLVRIEVSQDSIPTLKGAKVGDTEDRILALYPSLRRQPHKYTDGFYLIVIPGGPRDSLYRYVFETDGKRVLKYRAGFYPQVEYVEGCA